MENHCQYGVLKVTLYEGSGISMVGQYCDIFHGLEHEPSHEYEEDLKWGFRSSTLNHQSLPYALLDFDHSQVIVDAVSGTTKSPLWAGKETSYGFEVSRVAELTVFLYLRNPLASMGHQDFFLGAVKLHPWANESYKYDEMNVTASLGQESYAAVPKWLNVQNEAAKILIGVDFKEWKHPSVGYLHPSDNFNYREIIGGGINFTVSRVGMMETSRSCAVRQVRKGHNSVAGVNHALVSTKMDPFVIPLIRVFQDSNGLTLCSPFASGGHLFYHLQKERRFNINRSKFYCSELLCAFDHLHDLDIIYTRIKPKNIPLDTLGHIAICDFSLLMSKSTIAPELRILEYPAPEQLRGEEITEAVDWWTLGIFLYEFLTGLPPFYDEDTIKKHRKILSEPLEFPGPNLIPPAAQDVLNKLLNRNPSKDSGQRVFPK
ncbi:hypothetical protein OCU04_007228 [Sclerotinia nivalis]|uniref:Protein kinase domain-containing protein n=1 Tax=Sclerotinia nivalis TaxID=352851 RepID=A0A9X0DJ87_9HELO|nr:hypothetical protein OCU04_007228 [Sclerotinia nivalis]